jgi:Ca-activated chloride channel family protein
MMQPLAGGRTKLEAARSALARHWRQTQTQPNAGLRAYGHRYSAADEASCLDTELLAAIMPDNLAQMTAILPDLSARGMAPLHQALVEASTDFAASPDRANALILIADGGDSCGTDACQTVKTHQEVGIGVPIYVVGLAPDGEARQQLTCIAVSSKGRYQETADEAGLVQALDAFLSEIAAGAP